MSINDTASRSVGDENVLTSEEVLKLAQQISNDQLVRVLDYQLDNYSKELLGLTGSHQSLKVTFQRSNIDSPVTVNTFVKSLPKHDVGNAYMPILMQESFFFEKIIPELMHDYKSKRWSPTYYFTTKSFIIIEDLKFSGYRILDKIYDEPVALKSFIASIARFHSCSLVAEARLRRQAKHAVTLDRHFENAIFEMMFIPDGDGAKWYNCGVNLACALAERLGYDPKRFREVFGRVYDMVKPSDTHQNVICHGDLHRKNVMFADDSPAILIDFQILRYAPMGTDILQFLYLNTSRKFRDLYEKELIQYYHSVMVETIKVHDSLIEPPTLDSILKGLEDLRAYGLIIACIYMPLAFLDSEEGGKVTKDTKTLSKFLFGDRLELVSAHMQMNEIYKQLVENAIIELAEKAT